MKKQGSKDTKTEHHSTHQDPAHKAQADKHHHAEYHGQHGKLTHSAQPHHHFKKKQSIHSVETGTMGCNLQGF